MEIPDLISGVMRGSAHEMIAYEMPSLIDQALNHAFQSATLKAQGQIHTILYYVVEQMMLDLICQDILEETLKTLILQYFKVGKSAEKVSNKLLANHAFITEISTCGQCKATESVVSHHPDTSLQQDFTME